MSENRDQIKERLRQFMKENELGKEQIKAIAEEVNDQNAEVDSDNKKE